MDPLLHIDLLKCEFCAEHNKLLAFCSSCGKARTKRLVAQKHEFKRDRQLPYRCPVCYSQRTVKPHCTYCDLRMPLNRLYGGYVPPPAYDPKVKPKVVSNVNARQTRWSNSILGAAECACCLGTYDLTIHHFVPKSKGGTNEQDNRLVLCRKCHDKVHTKARPPKARKVEPERLKDALLVLAGQFEKV